MEVKLSDLVTVTMRVGASSTEVKVTLEDLKKLFAIEFGVQGPIGVRGPQGERGPLGPDGPRGPLGHQGIQGPEGPQGVQGLEGPIGQRGPVGEIGPQGFTGNQGPEGNSGPKCNYSATDAPQVSDNASKGYSIGSEWIFPWKAYKLIGFVGQNAVWRLMTYAKDKIAIE